MGVLYAAYTCERIEEKDTELIADTGWRKEDGDFIRYKFFKLPNGTAMKVQSFGKVVKKKVCWWNFLKNNKGNNASMEKITESSKNVYIYQDKTEFIRYARWAGYDTQKIGSLIEDFGLYRGNLSTEKGIPELINAEVEKIDTTQCICIKWGGRMNMRDTNPECPQHRL